jgi:hypothetical protein
MMAIILPIEAVPKLQFLEQPPLAKIFNIELTVNEGAGKPELVYYRPDHWTRYTLELFNNQPGY